MIYIILATPLIISIIAIAFIRAASIADARTREAMDAYADGDVRLAQLIRGDSVHHGGDY